jgi:hypothetical protein
MAINIKNERTVAAVKRLAARDGVSYTTAIDNAVEAALAHKTEDEIEAQIRQISQIAAEYRAHATHRPDTDELYDEDGLYR